MINAHKIKQDICEIGRRLYDKGFAAANDGNITVRISDNEVLCTPTMHSKGFLKVEDIWIWHPIQNLAHCANGGTARADQGSDSFMSLCGHVSKVWVSTDKISGDYLMSLPAGNFMA